MPYNPLQTQLAQRGMSKPYGFNPYAAGDKRYGLSGRQNATSGPLQSPEAERGYQQRDMNQRARRSAVLSRLKQQQQGNYMGSDALRGVK